MGRVEKDLRTRVRDWRGLLRRQVPVVRQVLTNLLDSRLVFSCDRTSARTIARVVDDIFAALRTLVASPHLS